MSSRNPLGDTSRGSTDDRNATGGGTSGGTSGGASGGGSVGDDRNTVADSGGRDRDDDDDPRNPLGDTSRGSTDDRRQTSGGGGGGTPEPPTTDLGDISAGGAVAAGLGGVAAPEPVSSVGGAVLATVGAGALAIDAARRSEVSLPDPSDITGTRSEVDVPDRPQQSIQNEIDAPRRRQTQTEISVPSRREQVTTTEVEVPDRPQRDVGEIETPTATGVLQRQREQEDDTVEIGGDDIVIPDEPERNPPSFRERRQRDDLRDFRERRDVGVSEGVVTEGVVGLGDTATQTETVAATSEPTLDPDVQTDFDTTTDTGSSGLDPVPPGAEQDDRRQTVPFNPVDTGAGGGLGAEPATGDNATTGA